MTMKKFFLILLCVLFISSAPLMYVFIFSNTLSYDMPESTQISYMDVITNKYVKKSYIDGTAPVDEQLDSALKKYKFNPIKLSDVISVLQTTDKENSEIIRFYHGNYDLIYVDGRQFISGCLIFAEDKTYFFAEYLSNKNYLGINPYMVTLYELQGEKPLDRNDFQHIKSENTQLFSKWIADRFRITYARIVNIVIENVGKTIFVTIVYVVLSGCSVCAIKKQCNTKSHKKERNAVE